MIDCIGNWADDFDGSVPKVFPSSNPASLARVFLGAILGGCVFSATSAGADAVTPSARLLDPIVVTAKKQPDPVPDEKLTEQVETALHSDPLFYDEHVTVTIRNGIVTLQGIVFDDWDLRQVIRLSRRVPGVKRVVNDLEIKLGGE
jgi:osmotically-inducible protein OsmY